MAATSQSQTSNPFLLAADNSPSLLPLLRSDPSLASAQDEHGYSLLHAACSYNHLDLLRSLVNEFHVNVNLVDEDGDTALFVAETLDCAKILVEELHADISIRNIDGKTARETIAEDDDFPQVAVYLRVKELEAGIPQTNGVAGPPVTNGQGPPPLVPEGMNIQFGEMVPEEELGEVVDPEFRRRIEELAARDDFQGEEGQRQLRELVTEVLRGEVTERDVRRRTS
ncbi:Ankyrin repeat-containing protein [Venustampulla echinocandica]|uniref:Ankyrin repeat-containing protein n=1 Tax=Venustampulla echinocandica TaxID=2656787 RepID=A0A370U3E0_9HELO|nr:Ankyrin repeat-containing protein [Venustampulla echinocandica]RDL42282.1 Ankyrin repeat-containing protein [Venustampulla echinocandica]